MQYAWMVTGGGAVTGSVRGGVGSVIVTTEIVSVTVNTDILDTIATSPALTVSVRVMRMATVYRKLTVILPL